jgi:suppressor of G2 allele of SKP1
MFKKGCALFNLEEYESAKEVFEAGLKVEPGASNFKAWLRKCDVELEAAGPSKPKAAPAPQKPVSSHPTPSAAPILAPPPKVKHDFYQNQGHVYVAFYHKKTKPENLQVNFTRDELHLSIVLDDGDVFNFDTQLCGPIVPEASTFKILSTKIELDLTKAEDVNWGSLGPSAVRQWADTAAVDKTLYPSSKGPKNWDAITKANYVEPEVSGDEALNKLFKDIYGKGNEETRMAMNKSFVESGGTILSTNWKEVGNKYQRGTPPKGLEMHDWNEHH